VSFHPNDMRRRGIAANVIVTVVLVFLGGGFFRTQVLQHEKYTLQSETNRLRELPLPAPRGVIYDRNGKVIADNVIGYTVSVLAQREDTLRAVLQRLTGTINITPTQIEQAIIGRHLVECIQELGVAAVDRLAPKGSRRIAIGCRAFVRVDTALAGHRHARALHADRLDLTEPRRVERLFVGANQQQADVIRFKLLEQALEAAQ
jgi:cell division protein FtsI/penicillin-binding protein 2